MTHNPQDLNIVRARRADARWSVALAMLLLVASVGAPGQVRADDEDEGVSLEELRRRAREKKAAEAKPEPAPPEPAKPEPAKPEPAKPEPQPEADKLAPGGAGPAGKGKSKGKGKRAAAQSDEPDEPDLPDRIPTPLYCPNPTEAPPSRAGLVRCVQRPGLAAARVVLFFRLPGKEDFEEREMTRTPRGWFVGEVPAEAFAGKFTQVYFQAQDRGGKVLAESGRWDSPNMILIRAGAPPLDKDAYVGMLAAAADGDGEGVGDDNPLARGGGDGGDDGPPEQRMWVALSLGSGLGGHGNADLEWYEYQNRPGAVAIAGGTRSAGPLVFTPEFGYRFTRRWSASAALRGQLLLHSGDEMTMAGAPAPAAFALLLRGIYTLPLTEKLTAQVWGTLGGGEGVRLKIPADPMDTSRTRRSSDTVLIGPVLLGAGAWLDYQVHEQWSARLTLPQLLLAMPATGWVLEFALGAVYAF